jgi:hypothetical protein
MDGIGMDGRCIPRLIASARAQNDTELSCVC